MIMSRAYTPTTEECDRHSPSAFRIESGSSKSLRSLQTVDRREPLARQCARARSFVRAPGAPRSGATRQRAAVLLFSYIYHFCHLLAFYRYFSPNHYSNLRFLAGGLQFRLAGAPAPHPPATGQTPEG